MKRKLTGSIRQYKKSTILTPIFVAIEVVMDVLIPLLMAELIDKGIDLGEMSMVWKMGIALLISAGISLIFGALSGKYAAHAACGFAQNLRKDMYYNVQNFSFSNIDKFSTSSIITRLTTDVTNVQNAFQMIIRFAVRCPLMLLFSLGMSFSINWQMALIFLVMIPVIGLGLWLILTRAHPLFERVFHTYDKLNNVVQENLNGIRVVKSFVREDHEKQKFGKVSDSIYRDFSKAEKIVSFNMPLMQIAVYACILLISWFGARIIVTTHETALTTGQLSSLITYATQILMSLMMLSMVFIQIVISRESVARIKEILNEESDLKNPPQPVMQVADGSVCFENVSFSYANDPHKLCLSGVDLRIESGQTVGIIGGTGTSKSTLVQLIPRLYDATEGRVLVGGVDVRDYDLETLREQVAMVLQKNELFSGTIKENLRWGNEHATDEELIHACKLAQADDFIQGFPNKYDTYIEQGGTNVSGGQKQRLCIARALLKKPKILILDDSTSAVDTATDAKIRQAFREEIPNTTKFIIAQRISSVEDADCIIVMESGKVRDFGTHSQLMQSSEIYREVYESQKKGGDEHEQSEQAD